MCKYVYMPSHATIVMPENNSYLAWKTFFEHLMVIDYYAPLHVVVAYFEILFDVDKRLPPSSFDNLYYDVGISMATDDESPAFEAAADAGFLSRGLCQVIDAAESKDEFWELYDTILAVITDKSLDFYELISQTAYDRACELLAGGTKNNEEKGVKLPVTLGKKEWVHYFESIRKADPCASASIFAYYVEEINEHDCLIFCPLGYEQYQKVGEMMRNHDTVLDAALQSGLLAEAIPTYFGAALDNATNWSCMVRAIRFLVDSSTLRCLVPLKKRVMAEKLLARFGVGAIEDSDEDTWYQACSAIADDWETDIRNGYFGY